MKFVRYVHCDEKSADFSFLLTFVVQMISHLLVIIIQHTDADCQGDFWSELEWLGRVLHGVYPSLKLKTQQHRKTDDAQGCQDDRQGHAVTEDVSLPGRVMWLYSSSYFTGLIITLWIIIGFQSVTFKR